MAVMEAMAVMAAGTVPGIIIRGIVLTGHILTGTVRIGAAGVAGTTRGMTHGIMEVITAITVDTMAVITAVTMAAIMALTIRILMGIMAITEPTTPVTRADGRRRHPTAEAVAAQEQVILHHRVSAVAVRLSHRREAPLRLQVAALLRPQVAARHRRQLQDAAPR